jgi:integrase
MQPTNNNGSIIIRFTKFGYKYSLTQLGSFTNPSAISIANRICLAIANDIDIGRFTPKNNDELFTAYHPMAKLSRHHESSLNAVDCLALVEAKLASQELRDRNLYQTANFLRKYNKSIKSVDDALKFWQWLQLTSKGNAKTINRHLESLKPLCSVFRDIPKLKTKQGESEKPFTKDEIKKISNIFSTKYMDYVHFIQFLFSTGCRTSEAIALTWDCIDYEAKTITIRESIGIAKDGSKVRKATKTGVVRTVPMSYKVELLLRTRAIWATGKDSDNPIVFHTPRGLLIDIRNFRERIWVQALTDADVPYRSLYNTRHTFCSHFLNETPDFVKLASITHGTKSGVATLQKHYASIVEKVSMPDMF